MPLSFDPDWQALIVGSGIITVPGTSESGVQVVAFTVGDDSEADLDGWTEHTAIVSTLGDGGVVHHYVASRPASASDGEISLSGAEGDAAGIVGTFPGAVYVLTPAGASSLSNPNILTNAGFPIEEQIATPGVTALATFSANDVALPDDLTATPQSGEWELSPLASGVDDQGAEMRVQVVAVEPSAALTDVQWTNGRASDRRWVGWVSRGGAPRWWAGVAGWSGPGAATGTYSIDVEAGSVFGAQFSPVYDEASETGATSQIYYVPSIDQTRIPAGATLSEIRFSFEWTPALTENMNVSIQIIGDDTYLVHNATASPGTTSASVTLGTPSAVGSMPLTVPSESFVVAVLTPGASEADLTSVGGSLSFDWSL